MSERIAVKLYETPAQELWTYLKIVDIDTLMAANFLEAQIPDALWDGVPPPDITRLFQAAKVYRGMATA